MKKRISEEDEVRLYYIVCDISKICKEYFYARKYLPNDYWNVDDVVTQVEERVRNLNRDITVAVMGCVVNGPGEAREADFGIAGGKNKGLLFRKGEVLGTYPYDELLPRLLDLIENSNP